METSGGNFFEYITQLPACYCVCGHAGLSALHKMRGLSSGLMAQCPFTRIGPVWAGFVCLKLVGSCERSNEFAVL